MIRTFHNIQVGLDEDLAEKLSWLAPDYGSYRIVRQSVDARQRHHVHFVYSVDVADPGEAFPEPQFHLEQLDRKGEEKPLIIGSGPAGLFAALRLVERGVPCILLERGSAAEKRILGINKFWRRGELDRRNNVCFGEGGAGLFSDGKLVTRIKSPHIPYVLNRLVRFGAPAEIEYLANPHVGSDRLRRVIPRLRQHLLDAGCEIHFDTQVTEIQVGPRQVLGVKTERGDEFRAHHVILATGHSAEDMLFHLADQGVAMEGKSFAIGLRIEHPQAHINTIQYRDAAEHPKLGAANYRLADHDSATGIGVYSFCMCPGGYVLSSGTEADGLVCNGMSNYRRNSPFANAAIVASIDYTKTFGRDLFAGLKFRRSLETQAYAMVKAAGGTKELPGQRLTDFFAKKRGDALPNSSPSGVRATPLHELLPEAMNKHLRSSLEKFDRQMKGFIHPSAQLIGVESRTSCPVRVLRDPDTLMSPSHSGLYPCGEGAGYAGGITSAACDGIRVADAICEQLSSQKKGLAEPARPR